MGDDIFPYHGIHGASLLQRRKVLLSNSSPSFHLLPAGLSEGRMGALHTARSSLPFTKKDLGLPTTSVGLGWLLRSLLQIHGELWLHFQCMRRLHISFLWGEWLILFSFFSPISRHFMYLSPLFLLLRREGYYGNEEMTETMSIRRKCGNGAGVFGGTTCLSHMEWAFLHGEGAKMGA